MDHTQTTPVPAAPKRGFLLTTWLVLMLIGYGIGAFAGLLGGGIFATLAPATGTPWVMVAYGVLSLIGFVATIFLFKWKQWAFWAVMGISALAVGYNIIDLFGDGTFGDVLGSLVSPALLGLFVYPKWKHFS